MTRQIVTNKENFNPENYLKLSHFIDSTWFQSNLLNNINCAMPMQNIDHILQKALEKCFKYQNLSNYKEIFINELVLVLDFDSNMPNPTFEIYDAKNFVTYIQKSASQNSQNLAINVKYNRAKIYEYLKTQRTPKNNEGFAYRPQELYRRNPLYQHNFLPKIPEDTFKAHVSYAAITDIMRDYRSIFSTIKYQNYFVFNNSKMFDIDLRALDDDGNNMIHYLGLYPEFDIDSKASFGLKQSFSYWPDFNPLQIIYRYQTNINEQNKFGQTPLVVAAANPQGLKIVKYLRAAYAQIEISDYSGKTALLAAVEKGNYDIVRFLLKEKARHDICDYDDNNILDLAIKSHNIELVDFIINQFYQNLYENPNTYYQALINSVNNNNQEALNLICQRINRQISKNHFNKINYREILREVLFYTIKNNHISFISRLLKINNDLIHTQSKPAEIIETSCDELEVILLSDIHGKTVIHEAVIASNPEALAAIYDFCPINTSPKAKKLLDIIDTRPDSQGLTPFFYAVFNLDINMVKILINQYQANPFKVVIIEDKATMVADFALDQFKEFEITENQQFNQALNDLKQHYELAQIFQNDPRWPANLDKINVEKLLIEKISNLAKRIIELSNIANLKTLLDYTKILKIHDKILIDNLPILEYLIISDRFEIIQQAQDIFDDKKIISKFLQPKSSFVAKCCLCLYLSKHLNISPEMTETLKTIAGNSEPTLMASLQIHSPIPQNKSKNETGLEISQHPSLHLL